MGQSILYHQDSGQVGTLARPAQNTVEAKQFDSGNPFTAYGLPGKMVAGKFVPLTANNDVALGFLHKVVPDGRTYVNEALEVSVPPTKGLADVLTRGYIFVKVQLGAASAADGSAVYVRYQNAGGGKIVGGIEGSASADAYVLAGARFMGPADANGVAEVAFDI